MTKMKIKLLIFVKKKIKKLLCGLREDGPGVNIDRASLSLAITTAQIQPTQE